MLDTLFQLVMTVYLAGLIASVVVIVVDCAFRLGRAAWRRFSWR